MYVVIFRSTVLPEADRALMRELDDAAYAEALESGGLLDYVRGSDDGAKASVCVWETREDAKRAAALPKHQEAVRNAPQFYSEFWIRSYE